MAGGEENVDPGAQARVFTAKGLATRARIVEAAAAVVFENGVAGTSLEEVQKRAGVSNSQIYHYFRDKRDVIHAVIAFESEGAVVNTKGPLGGVDSMAALRAWADYHVKLQVQLGYTGCRLGSLLAQVARDDPEAGAGVGDGFVVWAQSLAEDLRTMQDRGELRPDADPDQLGTALMAALQGGLMLAQSQRSVTPLETALNVVIDHIESLCTTG
jgi:TetR/AcrR family transcriptional regulator, transcriptional repressor for nem operon